MLETTANFLLYIGFSQLVLAGVIFIFMTFPDRSGTPSLLTSKKLQQSLIQDYEKRRAKIGGILGITIILIKSGIACVALSALLWFTQKAMSYLPLF